MKANYQTAADVFDTWRDDVLSGTPPTLYPCGSGELGHIELGPGRVLLLGGPPGLGKTALVMQLICDALKLTPTLKALIANVEMPVGTLLDRQLARLAGVDATTIRHRALTASDGSRLDAGLSALESIIDRLAFLKAPFDLCNVAAAADEFGAELVCLDYVQRFGSLTKQGDNRTAINETMTFLRMFADAGLCIFLVASVGRQRDRSGRSSYDGLGLASFKESGELEFGCDDAFILSPHPKNAAAVVLQHLKSRHGQTKDICLTFDRRHQSFTPDDSEPADEPPPDGKLLAALRGLWGSIAADTDEPDGGDDEEN